MVGIVLCPRVFTEQTVDTVQSDGESRVGENAFRDRVDDLIRGKHEMSMDLVVTTESRYHSHDGADWRSADGTFALHEYDFDVVAARGETFVSGNDVDTAPRWLGSAGLDFDAGGRVAAALQWVAVGSYYLDAENQHSYPGHDILNLWARIDLSDEVAITARLNNVTDSLIADRADFAFGNYRYFPGRGRELFVQLEYR